MSNINKFPPLLPKTKSYYDWIQLVEVWRQFITLESKKQDPAIVLTLEGEAQDTVLEVETSGVTKTRWYRQNYCQIKNTLKALDNFKSK